MNTKHLQAGDSTSEHHAALTSSNSSLPSDEREGIGFDLRLQLWWENILFNRMTYVTFVREVSIIKSFIKKREQMSKTEQAFKKVGLSGSLRAVAVLFTLLCELNHI